MASFDLTRYLEDDAVVLKIQSDEHPDGRDYRFESPSFEVGLWLKNLIEFGRRAALGAPVKESDLQKLVLDDDDEQEEFRRVMGDTFEQMRADGVSWGRIQKVYRLLLKKWGSGQEIEASLREDAAGEAPAPANRGERRGAEKAAKKAVRKPAKKTQKRSAPTAGSSSSRTSGGTKARTAGPASTRSSATTAETAAG